MQVWVSDGIYTCLTHVKVVLKAHSKQVLLLIAEEMSLYFFTVISVSFELFHSGHNEGGPHVDSTVLFDLLAAGFS